MRDSVVVAFPRSYPFKQSDFYPDPTFLSVAGLPVVLFSHAPVFVSYRSGKAEVVPQSILKDDNHEGLCYREFAELVYKVAKGYQPASPRPKFPTAWPFDRSDFPANAKFLDSEGAPFALLPSGPTLVNFFSGKARIIPISELKVDNHSEMKFEDWFKFVARSAASYNPDLLAAPIPTPPRTKTAPAPTKPARQPKERDITPFLEHPLNKAALALLEKHKKGGRSMPAIMPVLELCFCTMTQAEVESPKGMSVILADFRDPAEVLRFIEENVSPAELIEVDDLEVAGDIILRRVLKLEFADMPEFRAWDFY